MRATGAGGLSLETLPPWHAGIIILLTVQKSYWTINGALYELIYRALLVPYHSRERSTRQMPNFIQVTDTGPHLAGPFSNFDISLYSSCFQVSKI